MFFYVVSLIFFQEPWYSSVLGIYFLNYLACLITNNLVCAVASKGGVIFRRTLMFSVYFPVLAGYVHQYNSLNSQPDVMKSLYSPLQPSSSLEGLRYSIKNFKSQHTKFCSVMGREKEIHANNIIMH